MVKLAPAYYRKVNEKKPITHLLNENTVLILIDGFALAHNSPSKLVIQFSSLKWNDAIPESLDTQLTLLWWVQWVWWWVNPSVTQHETRWESNISRDHESPSQHNSRQFGVPNTTRRSAILGQVRKWGHAFLEVDATWEQSTAPKSHPKIPRPLPSVSYIKGSRVW